MSFYIVLNICDRYFPGISDFSCLLHLCGKTESVRWNINCFCGSTWVDVGALPDHPLGCLHLSSFEFGLDFFTVTVQPTIFDFGTFIRRIFSGESIKRSVIKPLYLLIGTDIVQLKQWNKLLCRILNFTLLLGFSFLTYFFVLSDQTVSLSGQV